MNYIRYLRIYIYGKKRLLSLIHRRIVIEAIMKSIRESYKNPKPCMGLDEFNKMARENQLRILNNKINLL